MVEVLAPGAPGSRAGGWESEDDSRRPRASRVLHLINGEVFSGAERVQQLLGRRLIEFGFEPFFACLKPGMFQECSGLPARQIWMEPMRHRLDLHVVSRLSRAATRAQIQLLHAHTPRTAMIASLVARRTGIPWLYHVHSPAARDSTRRFRNWINAWVERASLQNAQRIITVSKSLRREMLRRGWPRRRLVAIPNGVAEQEPIAARDRMGSADWTLGMLALIRPRKGIEVLLHAMKELHGRNPSARLEIIGGFESPQYESDIRALESQLGLESVVRWRGFTRDVNAALRGLDALVLPSLFGEGMPMVVLEALAVGVPVVATRVEGTPEVVREGQEGYLAAPADPSSLASVIEKMISDREAWCRMSERAHLRHRESFSDLRMAQCVSASYQAVLHETAPRRVHASSAQSPQLQDRGALSPNWLLPHARRLGSFLVDA